MTARTVLWKNCLHAAGHPFERMGGGLGSFACLLGGLALDILSTCIYSWLYEERVRDKYCNDDAQVFLRFAVIRLVKASLP